MISIDYGLSVPGYSIKQIGYQTLVRARNAKFGIEVTNNGQRSLPQISVALVLESYVGLSKPTLFVRVNPQVIKQIPPSNMVPLTFNIFPNFPGLIAVAVYITDASNNPVMSKRKEDASYQASPVRYWFHVVDNIAIDTLMAFESFTASKVGKEK